MSNLANIQPPLKYCQGQSRSCPNIATHKIVLVSKNGQSTTTAFRCEKHKRKPTVSRKIEDTIELSQSKSLQQVNEFLSSIVGRNIHSKDHNTKSPFEVKYLKDKGGVMCYARKTNKWKFVSYEQISYVSPLTSMQERMLRGEVCPYCGRESEYMDSEIIYGKSYGMIYICRHCDAYCGVHKNSDQALGRLANAELREWKKKAHDAFDPIWKSNLKRRKEAYAWLGKQIGTPPEYTHIGMMGVNTCKKVVEICKKELE